MAEGLFTLLILTAVMAVASFLAGILPLSVSLSRPQLRFISTLGMGVLVGTSLIVIIPEGVETLYSSNAVGHGSANARRWDSTNTNQVQWDRDLYAARSIPSALNGLASTPGTHAVDMPGPVIPNGDDFPPKTPTDPGVVGIMSEDDVTDDHSREEQHEDEAHHAWIGVALITGFILMFLIDKLPQYTTKSKTRAKTHHIALNNLGTRFNLHPNQGQEEEADTFLDHTHGTETNNRSFATTIGLVIHAAADGIALGASSSSTSNASLSLVIFFAIMVHKAPAAFGLTSILLKQGFSKRMARAHLVLFSLAAPAGALLTWAAAHVLGAGASSNAQSTKWWTGILLLFSAGTFLYVAMHSMQEVTASHHAEPAMNGHANGGLAENRDASHSETEPKPSMKDLGAAIFGMILPLFLQVGHAH